MGNRLHSVDAMRILAMGFIVMIHTNPFEGLGVYGNAANFAIETTARFAVPFFFVASGYFFAKNITTRDPTRSIVKQVTTLTSLYVFGMLLSGPVFLAGTAVRTSLAGGDIGRHVLGRVIGFFSPVELIYYGTSVSEILWFLPALIYSLLLIYAFFRLDVTAYLLPVALGIHVVGLLGASYTMVVDISVPIRDGLFFGFFYTSLGYAIYASEWRPDPDRSSRYLVATLLFAVLHIGERYVLGYALTGETFAAGVYAPSYTIATALVTLSLFVFLLSRPDLGKRTRLPAWGRTYAVGIYVVHPSVLAALLGVAELGRGMGYSITETLVWHLLFTPATFFGAFLVYLAANRVGLIEIGGPYLPIRQIRRYKSALLE